MLVLRIHVGDRYVVHNFLEAYQAVQQDLWIMVYEDNGFYK